MTTGALSARYASGAAKAMRAPSGLQTGVPAPAGHRADVVSATASPPSADSRWSCPRAGRPAAIRPGTSAARCPPGRG